MEGFPRGTREARVQHVLRDLDSTLIEREEVNIEKNNLQDHSRPIAAISELHSRNFVRTKLFILQGSNDDSSSASESSSCDKCLVSRAFYFNSMEALTSFGALAVKNGSSPNVIVIRT